MTAAPGYTPGHLAVSGHGVTGAQVNTRTTPHLVTDHRYPECPAWPQALIGPDLVG